LFEELLVKLEHDEFPVSKREADEVHHLGLAEASEIGIHYFFGRRHSLECPDDYSLDEYVVHLVSQGFLQTAAMYLVRRRQSGPL
jgi:hypothetical protein